MPKPLAGNQGPEVRVLPTQSEKTHVISSDGGETEKGKKRALRQLPSPSSPPPAKRPVPGEERRKLNSLEAAAKWREFLAGTPGKMSSRVDGFSTGPLQLQAAAIQAKALCTKRMIAELGRDKERLLSKLAALEAEHEHLVIRGRVLSWRHACAAEPDAITAERTDPDRSTHHAGAQRQHAWDPPIAPLTPLSPINNRGATNIHEVAIKDALIRSKDALIARQATFLKELMEAQRRLKRALAVANDKIALFSELAERLRGKGLFLRNTISRGMGRIFCNALTYVNRDGHLTASNITKS